MRQQGLVAIFRQDPHGACWVDTGVSAQRLATLRSGIRAAITRGLEADSDAAKVIRAVLDYASKGTAWAYFKRSALFHAFVYDWPAIVAELLHAGASIDSIYHVDVFTGKMTLSAHGHRMTPGRLRAVIRDLLRHTDEVHLLSFAMFQQ